ncbi:phospholipase A1 1-like [Contarinia nasturtii]|uniref:phospholipase A1 1-like n=1 Tax=Contarinia nasturtii TaxID=265458 RepID=UPI0012D3B369|nr:phospholipase A1 1-like [Contarinia nasturtii]
MIIFLKTIICIALLTECNAVGNGSSSSSYGSNYLNTDAFKYQGDPIRFSCVANSNSEFYTIDVNKTIPSALVDHLDNGKSLSLFFHEFTNIVDNSSDLFSSFAGEWLEASGNNICIVTYAYTATPSIGFTKNEILDKMLTTQRYEHVAKLVGELVLGVREKCINSNRRQCLKHLSQLDVSGFGFGAHIAGRTCQYLQRKIRQRPRILLALDPIKIPLLKENKIKETLRTVDADYVQVIHSSQEVGIWDQLGHVDIYVKYVPDTDLRALNNEHGIAFFIHVATSTKRLYLTAASNENGTGTISTVQFRTGTIECPMGVYSTLQLAHRGKKFGLWLENRRSNFWTKLGYLADAKLLANQAERRENESRDSDDDECKICYSNKKNIRLSCNHEMCYNCWVMWKYTLSARDKCPMCRQTITSVDDLIL